MSLKAEHSSRLKTMNNRKTKKFKDNGSRKKHKLEKG